MKLKLVIVRFVEKISMIDAEAVGVKLTTIAQLAEELSSELFTDTPETSKKFGKIAGYCRRIATCVRMYGQVPMEKPKHPAARLLMSVDRIAQAVVTVVDQLPRGDSHVDR